MQIAKTTSNTPPTEAERLQQLPTHELRAELGRALSISAEHLVYLAAVWSELQRRGEDLSDLRSGLATYLPQIALGRLDANAVIQYAGNRTMLRMIAELPIETQQSLLAGDAITVLSADQDGKYVEKAVTLSELNIAQARLAIAGGYMRPVAEQRQVIEAARRAQAKRLPTPARSAKARLDPRTGHLVVGRARVPVGEVLGALADGYFDRAEREIPDRGAIVNLTLSEDEHRALKVRAAEANLTMQKLLRGLLGAMGAFG